MSLGEVVQVVSLGTVSVALVLSVWQNRVISRQTREIAEQTALASSSARRSTAQEMTRHSADLMFLALSAHPELRTSVLREIYGLPTSTDEDSLRLLYLFVRTDIHESHFRGFSNGLLDPD